MATHLNIIEKASNLTGAGNSETIYTQDIGVAYYDCGGSSRTGVIVEAGTEDGTVLKIVNTSDAAETITFAADATSFVAGGTGIVIGQNEHKQFVWSETLNRWVPGDVIGTSDLADGSVTLAKLASGVTPSHVVKYAGNFTWSGSGASKAQTVTGVAATDTVIVTIKTAPTQAAYVVSAAPTTNTITVTLSAANTSNDAVISYTVFRAAA